jgi:ATP-dependent Clp protease ATP-binding subunit ClpA
VFERFTDRARRVVVLAQENARMLNHNYIGTEHILLGLAHEGEGIAAKALESLGISWQAIQQQVEEIIGRGQSAPTGHVPFTPRAKKVLELSLRESRQLGHNVIGTEHILLGLIREGEGVGAQVLVNLGADLDRARQAVLGLLPGDVDEETRKEGGASEREEPKSSAGMARVDERAEMAIHLARRRAIERHRAEIAPVDVFWGLLASGDPGVEKVLRDLGVDPDEARKRLSEHEKEPGSAEPDEPGS